MGKPLTPAQTDPRDDAAQLRLIADNMPAMSAVYDRDLRYVFANLRYAEFFGCSSASIVGKHLREIVGEGPYQEVKPYFDQVLAGHRSSYTRAHMRDGGEPRHLAVELIPHIGQDGGILGLFAVTADVTERRRAEDALRASEARFRSLTELSSDWYWEQDENFRFKDRSPKLANTGFFEEQELRGKTRWELDITPEPGHDLEAHRQTLAAHLPYRDFEYSFALRGSRQYLSSSGIPLFDDQGRFTGYAVVGRDITERKQSEEALRQSEQRFRDLTELSTDWYWEQDENCRFSLLSRNWGINSGLGVDMVLGKTRWELPIAGVSEEQWRAHRELLARREPFRDFIYEIVSTTGVSHWYSTSGRPIFGADGRFLGYRGASHDITNRVLAERALRESERELRAANEQLQMLIQSSPLAIYTRDVNGRLTSWNPAAEKMYGWKAAEVLGKPLPTVPEEKREESEQLRMRLLAGESFINIQTHRRRRDGSRVDIEGFMGPLRDAAGNLSGGITIIADITDRKWAEEVLRQSEQRFRDLTELSSDWYWEQDDQFRFTYRSPDIRADAIAPQDVLGKRRWEIPGFEVSEAQWAQHKAVLEAHQPFREFEFWRRQSNGQRMYVSVSGHPMFSDQGAFLGYRGVASNITQRKQTAETLRESEARLRDAQHLARLGSWELDLVANTLTWSEEVFRIYEIDPEQFGASYETFLAAVHPEDRDAVNAVYTRSVRERTPYAIAHRLLMADGRVKHVQEHGHTDYDERGRPLRSIGTIQDISEQKQVEAELRSSSERLQNMARRLGEAQEVERRRLAAELHDGVCSNLAAIGLNLVFLQKQLPHSDAASMQQRLSDLIELIDEAKANARDISVDLRPLLLEERDLFPALEEYARKFEGATGIAVRVKGANSERRLPAEKKIALFRIAQEALTNCAKHAQASMVAIELNSAADHLLLSVADDGVGMDLAGIDVNRPGLGLLSMQERAESIGGRWQIESTRGKGTRVSVSLGAPVI